VIGADTTVVCKGNILAKPLDATDAKTMLRQLSGNWHSVLTGVAIINTSTNKQAVDICQTQVKFSQLTDQEIDWYIATGEPFDKAGAYAIQGYGSIFIEEIVGNYLNVVGLPITLVRKLFRTLGEELIKL
jgi:septum formation protein